MITLQDVYDALLSQVDNDDWSEVKSTDDFEGFLRDWRALLNLAISEFKFPRCSLEIDEALMSFKDAKMGLDEVNILAIYMRKRWLAREVMSWKNIKTQYSESDFSQANLLNSLIKLEQQANEDARLAEAKYYRSRNKKPFNYGKLAGRH